MTDAPWASGKQYIPIWKYIHIYKFLTLEKVETNYIIGTQNGLSRCKVAIKVKTLIRK